LKAIPAAWNEKLTMPPLNFMRTDIDHLPEKKQRELACIQEILFEEFDLAKGNGHKVYTQKGRILKIVLFGSYARGDWVDQANIVIGKWLKQYNHIRPHQALNMRPPVPEILAKIST
jgi:integrase-like protein